MMNYMKSEFYRAIRNRNLWILLAACTGLMVLAVGLLGYFKHTDVHFPYGNTRFALSNIYMQMGIALIISVIFAGFIHDSEEKQHTIKHSVAFGLKRSTIFLGRFFVQAIVSSVLYVILVSFFAGISFLFLQHSNQGEIDSLIRISAGSITCLLAGLAITHYFLMITESETVAYLQAFGVLMILPILCNIIGRKIDVIKNLAVVFPYNVIAADGALVSGDGDIGKAMLSSLLIGSVWVLIFLVAGVLQFQKKEVK